MPSVRALMSAKPMRVAPGASLREVVQIMNTEGCREIPVVENGLLVGIVTDRDVRLAVDSPVLDEPSASRLSALENIRVEACMSPDPITVSPDQAAEEVADLLSLHRVGAFPVVEDGNLVGIISTTDYLRYFAVHGS